MMLCIGTKMLLKIDPRPPDLNAKVAFGEAVGHEVGANDVTGLRDLQLTVEPLDVLVPI
jgi:hypothetical protein